MNKTDKLYLSRDRRLNKIHTHTYVFVVISIQRILVGEMDFWILMRPVVLEWSTEGLRSLQFIWVWGSTEHACTYSRNTRHWEGGSKCKGPEEDRSLFCWRHREEPPATGGTGFGKGNQDLRPKRGVGRAEHVAPYRPWGHWLSPREWGLLSSLSRRVM